MTGSLMNILIIICHHSEANQDGFKLFEHCEILITSGRTKAYLFRPILIVVLKGNINVFKSDEFLLLVFAKKEIILQNS